MNPEDIIDRDTLEAWLSTRPQADAVAIAHRAAMRVLPRFVRWLALRESRNFDRFLRGDAARPLDGFGFRLHLNHPVAAEDFLRFGERTDAGRGGLHG